MKNKLIEIQKKHSYLLKRSWTVYWHTVADEFLGLVRHNCMLCDPALPESEQRLSADYIDSHKLQTNLPIKNCDCSDCLSASEPDIRMRVWIPYSLKSGLDLGRDVVRHEPPEKDLPGKGWQWVEFVAVNDPLAEMPILPKNHPQFGGITNFDSEPE